MYLIVCPLPLATQVDGKSNPKIQSIFVEQFPIHAAHFTRDGREVVMASQSRHFYYYDMIAGKVVRIPPTKGNIDVFDLLL